MGIHSASRYSASTTHPRATPISTRTQSSSLKHKQISQEITSIAPTMNMYELLAELPDNNEESITDVPTDTKSMEALKQSLEDDNNDDSVGSKTDGDDEEDEEDIATHTIFDLLALEQTQGQTPIFTSALLQRIASEVSTILAQQSLPIAQRTKPLSIPTLP
jgi:hypothetical protein